MFLPSYVSALSPWPVFCMIGWPIQEPTYLQCGSRCLVDVFKPVWSEVYTAKITRDDNEHVGHLKDLE